jgi:hypothetical protein
VSLHATSRPPLCRGIMWCKHPYDTYHLFPATPVANTTRDTSQATRVGPCTMSRKLKRVCRHASRCTCSCCSFPTTAETLVEVEGEGAVRLEQLCHLGAPEEGNLQSLYPHMQRLVQELSWQWCCGLLPVHHMTPAQVRIGALTQRG